MSSIGAAGQEIHVWVVEDNTFLRDTVSELLAQRPGMRCTLAASSCEEALAALRRGHVPQVVHEDDDKIFAALCAGACGYLLKPASSEQIVAAVDTALHGGAPMNAVIARRVLGMFTQLARPRGDHGITEREREILQLLVAERSQKQIAQALELSPHTVDTHLRNIYAKLHVHSRSGAVAKAVQERLV